MTTTNSPIACTLDADGGDRTERLREWHAVLVAATGREEIDEGIAVTFDHDIARTAELGRLLAAEYACCSFASYQLTIDARGYAWRSVPRPRPGTAWPPSSVPADMAERNGLRTSEVAQRAGVNIQTLRYYERRGLIAEPVRSLGGHRAYPPDTVALIGVIKAAQRLGFTLDEVTELLDASRHRHRTPDLKQRALDKIVEIDRKIADLAAIRESLTQVVAAECASLTNCTCPDCPLPGLDQGCRQSTK
jgi:DNA-binding transcriptional MerR regulator